MVIIVIMIIIVIGHRGHDGHHKMTFFPQTIQQQLQSFLLFHQSGLRWAEDLKSSIWILFIFFIESSSDLSMSKQKLLSLSFFRFL